MGIPNRSSAFITSHSATIQLSANIGIAIINSGSAHIQPTHNIGIILGQQFTATKCHSQHKSSLPYEKSTASSGNTRNIGRTSVTNWTATIRNSLYIGSFAPAPIVHIPGI